MNILVIIANPNPDSFCHAIAVRSTETLSRLGYHVICHDLYREHFDPILYSSEIPRDAVLDPVISEYCNEISGSDGIVIIHPNWWGMPPAILTGWVDRVIRPGMAYRFVESDKGEGVPVGLLKARTAVVFNTSNTPPDREEAVFGDPLERIWKDCIFGLCGISDFHRRMFRVIVTSSEQERKEWLSESENILTLAYGPCR